MNKHRIRCKKIGKGTAGDPIRPQLPKAFDDFHQELINWAKNYREITNVTFYIMQVVKETDTEFEVEIIFPDDECIEQNCPRPVVLAWQKLKQSLSQ